MNHRPFINQATKPRLAQSTDPKPPFLTHTHTHTQVTDLPDDIAELHRTAGLRSFAAIVVGVAGSKPLGALILGSRQPAAFGDHR